MAEMERKSNWWMMYISKKCNDGDQIDKYRSSQAMRMYGE